MASRSDYEAWMRDGERRQRRWTLVRTIVISAAALIAIVVGFLVLVNLEAGDERARDAIESSGFSDVELGGPDPLVCGEGEVSRHFTATNPRGQRVEGTVCCGLTGLGKGCTLRWAR